jgi:hypothetical protein
MAQTPPPNKGTGWGYRIPAAAMAATFSSFSPYIATTDMTQMAPPTQMPGAATASFDERLIDAKLAAVEARTETKFAQLIGKMDLISQGIAGVKSDIGRLDTKIDTVDGHARSGKLQVIVAIVTTGFAAVGLVWGGVQICQGGMSLTSGAFQAGISAAQVKK